jgi:hypothetical protein
MTDIIFLVLLLALFLASVGLVRALERLGEDK